MVSHIGCDDFSVKGQKNTAGTYWSPAVELYSNAATHTLGKGETARPAKQAAGGWGADITEAQRQPGLRGNDHLMSQEMGGSLMQMRRKGEIVAPPCQARPLGPCLARVLTPVTASVGQLDKNEDIIPLRLWDTGTPAGRDEASSRAAKPPEQVAFDRKELQTILGFYGGKVAEGEWRDYAMDFGRDKAVFSVFRRASEMPLYRIVKDPSLTRKQGLYSVIAHGGLILKRGHDLAAVLRILVKTPKLTSL